MKRLKSAWTLLTIGGLLIAADLGVRAAGPAVEPLRPETEFSDLSAKILDLFKSEKERRIERHMELERMKKDLRYMSEELDRETLEDEDTQKPLAEYSAGGLARLETLRLRGNLDPNLAPILSRLEKLYRELPSKAYAKDYAGNLVKAIDEELRWASEEGATDAEIIAILKRDLVLPASMPGENDVEDLAFFPQDLPLDKFLKLGPIKIFLMKHRLKRPPSYTVTTAKDIIEGKHHVQIGVTVEGTVTWAEFFPGDGDYCFNFGELHMEITPEWRASHKNFPTPKVGQRIRVKGWTYYDYFHKSELEYDPADPVVGVQRSIVWEVHPIQDVEILSN